MSKKSKEILASVARRVVLIGIVSGGAFILMVAGSTSLEEDTRLRPSNSVVSAEQFIYTCDICENEEGEGYYSYTDGYGYIECKSCGHYAELGGGTIE